MSVLQTFRHKGAGYPFSQGKIRKFVPKAEMMSKYALASLAIAAAAFEGADAFAAGSTLPSTRAAQRSAACSLRMSSEVCSHFPLPRGLFLSKPLQNG
jgi:hypothetical protein